jgi:anti-sigma-K factor RskA
MIAERHEELAALHALDLLDHAERDAFARELEQSAELRALVAELRESAALLAHTAPDAAPPAELRARVLASVESKIENQESKIIRPPVSVFRSLVPWAAAAAFALLAGWFGQRYLASRSEAEMLGAQQMLADLALKSARNQLETERILARRQLANLTQQVAVLDERIKHEADLANFKITTLASMLNNSPQAVAVAVWNPEKQEGVLQVAKLPALAADKDYQLWVVDPQYPNPVDGGVFTVDPQTGEARLQFKAKQPVKAINAFAVTLERKGGVPKAEGPFVLLGK